MKKITVLLSVLVLALGILAAGCGGGDKKDEKKQAAAPAPAAKEELLVGTEPSFAPFEFPEKDSKEFTGFDMDLIRAIAKEVPEAIVGAGTVLSPRRWVTRNAQSKIWASTP